MHPEYPAPTASNQPTPQLRPSKATTQKQYREKEGECFDALRNIIEQLTGEALQTRREILGKATWLLFSLLETRRQEQAEVNPSMPYEMPVTGVSNLTDATSAHLAYVTQPYSLQPWQNAQARAEWQYPSMSDADFAFEELAGNGEFSENWPHDPQV